MQMRTNILTKILFYIGGALLLLFGLVACNQDGVGVFYNISTEIKLKESAISELAVHQVVDTGTTLYVRTGLSVWKYGSGDWKEIISGDAGSIANAKRLDGGEIAAVTVNNSDNPTSSSVHLYNVSSWSEKKSYDSDSHIVGVDSGDHFFINRNRKDNEDAPHTYSTDYSGNLSDFDASADNGTYELLKGAAVSPWNSNKLTVITKNAVFQYTAGNTPFPSAAAKIDNIDGDGCDGTFSALAPYDDGGTTQRVYIATTKGELFYTDDGSTFTEISTAGTSLEDVKVLSMEVFSPDGTKDYLLIGAKGSGFYEMDLGDNSISGPENTVASGDSSEFAASYPDLAYSSVFDIVVSEDNSKEFYLASEIGLWKRDKNGDFDKM